MILHMFLTVATGKMETQKKVQRKKIKLKVIERPNRKNRQQMKDGTPSKELFTKINCHENRLDGDKRKSN